MSRLSTEQIIPVISAVKKRINEISSGKLIYLTVSGSDLYGWPSPDSDIDLRGCFLAHTNMFLGLSRFRETIVSLNPDYQVHELRKVINLALKGNCNIIEHIMSKPIFSTPEYIQLKSLVGNSLAKKGLYNSYRGMATFNYKKFILGGKTSYKKYLYVFRGLLAGRYLLETGQIQADITQINRVYKLAEINRLVDAKKNRNENAVVEDMDSGRLDELIQYCYQKIDLAYEKCQLPETPSKKDARELNSFLIQLRKQTIR